MSFVFNYVNDRVLDGSTHRDKHSYDLFTGVSQILDKDTLISVNLTLEYNKGFLNDPYKVVQRNEIASIPDGLGGTTSVPVVDIYPEYRPDTRSRQVFVQTINGINIRNPVNPNPRGTNYSADYRALG